MSERYRAWRPELWPTLEVDLGGLTQDCTGLRILLSPLRAIGPIVEVHFLRPRMYRNIDEGFRLRQLSEFKPEGASLVYIVDDSILLREFHDQSFGVMRSFNLIHFLVTTSNDCIDVLSEVEPVVVVWK